MQPVTQTNLVRAMHDHGVDRRVPENLQTYLRTEYGGDGSDAAWLLSQARSQRSAAPKSSRRGLLSGLFEALGAAFTRPGGA